MTAFMDWLRVELLRLRSLDWGNGSRSIHSLKDGVTKLSSSYLLTALAEKLGISEDEILAQIGSPSVINELEGKSFTISWDGKCVVLSWLEEGISEWKTEINRHYYEEGGKYFVKSRWLQRIIYLDGTDRVVSDSGELGPTALAREEFEAAHE